jgi:S1-C subfamily serine protease
MKLQDSYKIVKKGIVAIVMKYIPLKNENEKPLPFPPIIGTGFIIRENGLIATNNHVFEKITKLFRPPDLPKDDWPARVIVFKNIEQGLLEIPFDILGIFELEKFIPGEVYYGSEPDIAFIQIKVKGLEALMIDDSLILEEGLEVATAGFPMGINAFFASGKLGQIAPTIQKGIISAILPFACPTPHAFTVNIMVQVGASGSPIFLPDTGKVIGILYAGLRDVAKTYLKDIYKIPTNISYALPSKIINESLKEIENNLNFNLPKNTKSIDEIIKNSQIKNVFKNGRSYQIKKVQS